MTTDARYVYFLDDDAFQETDRAGFRRRVVNGETLQRCFWRIADQAADGSASFDEACEHGAIRQISVGLWSRRETRDWQTAFTGGEKAYQQRINGMATSCCQ